MKIKYLLALSFLHSFLFAAETRESIDHKINELKTTLSQIEKDEERKQVESQKYLIAEWEKYGQEMEKIREIELDEKQIQKQIDELEKQKAQLIPKQ